MVAWDGGLIEDSSAVRYRQGRPTVCRAPDEHMINTAKGSIPVGRKRIIRREGDQTFSRSSRLPRTAIGDAHVINDMPTGPEPDAVRGFIGIHVPSDDDMARRIGNQSIERRATVTACSRRSRS